MIFQDGFGSTARSLFAGILGQAMTPEALRKLQEAVSITVVKPPAKEMTSAARLADFAVSLALIGRLSRYRAIGISQPQFKQSRRTEISRDLYNATVTLAIRWINGYRLDQVFYYPPEKTDYVVTDEDVLADARGKAGDYCRAAMAARNYYPAAVIAPTPAPAVRPTPPPERVIATPALIATPAPAAVRPAAAPAVAPEAVGRMRPVSPEFLAQIVDEQLERYEIARMPGSIGGKTWDKIVKNASELYLINAFGLAVHPYSVFHAKIDLVIKDTHVRLAEGAIRRELGRRDYTQGGRLQAAFVPPKGVTPEFGVGYQWPSAGKAASAGVQTGVASVVGRVPGRGERVLLTNDECKAILQQTMDAISGDKDAERHAKGAAIKMGVKYSSRVAPGATTLRVVVAGAGFYKELSKLGITCHATASPEGIVHNPILRAMTLHGVKPQPSHRREAKVLAPDVYDTIANTAARLSMQEWEAHKLKLPDPKFRTREVTGGEAEWRQIVAERFTRATSFYRGELPMELRPYTREAAIRAVQVFQKQALQRIAIPLQPGTLSPGVWKELINFPIYWPASIAMLKLLPHRMMAASEREILEAGGPYVRNKSGHGGTALTSLARSVVSEALTAMGYRQKRQLELYRAVEVRPVAPAVVTPAPAVAPAVVTPAPAVVPAVVTPTPAVVAPTPRRRATEGKIRSIVYKRAKRTPSSRRRGKTARWLSPDQYQKFVRGCVAEVLKEEGLSGFGQVTPTADTREEEIRQSVERYMPTYAVLSIPPTVTPVIAPAFTPALTPPVPMLIVTPVVTPPAITPVAKLIVTPVVTPPEITPVVRPVVTPVVTPPGPDRAMILKQVTDQILQSYRYPLTVAAGRKPPVMTGARYHSLVAKIQAQAKVVTRRWGEYMFYSDAIEKELKSRGFFPPVDSGILADTWGTAYKSAVDEIVRGPQWTPRGVRLIPAGTTIPRAEYDAMIERMVDRAIAIFIEILNRDYGAGQGEHYASVGSYSKRTRWISGVRDWLNFRRIYRGRAVAVTPVVTPAEITPVVRPVVTPVVTPAVRYDTHEDVIRRTLEIVFRQYGIPRVSPGTYPAMYLSSIKRNELIGDLVSESQRQGYLAKVQQRAIYDGLPGLSRAAAEAILVDRNILLERLPAITPRYITPPVTPAEITRVIPEPTPALPSLDEWARTAPVFPDYAACMEAAQAATGRVPDRYEHCTCIADAVTRAVDNALEEGEVTTKAITPYKYAAVVSDAVNVGNQMVAQRSYSPAIPGRRVAFPRRR